MAELDRRLAVAKAWVFDMDGTLVLGDRESGGHKALPGSIEMLARLRERGTPFRVFTNGTAKAPPAYAASLRAAGLDVRDEEMMTPSTAAAAWLAGRGIRRVRVLGNQGTAAPLVEAGIDVAPPEGKAEAVEAVYTGWHREFAFPHLEAAAHDIWAGARLVTASHVRFFATADGRGIGTSFAMNAALGALTGKRAKVLGKPATAALGVAVRAMGLRAADIARVVVVGDDPALESRMANAAGAISVGVASGLNSLGFWATLPDRDRPQLAVEGVASLIPALA